MAHCIHCRLRVLAVIGAYGHRIKVLLGYHLTIIGIIVRSGHLPVVKEFSCLAGNDVGACGNLHIVKELVCLDVRTCDTAGANKADAQFAVCLYIVCYLCRFLEFVKVGVFNKFHVSSPFVFSDYIIRQKSRGIKSFNLKKRTNIAARSIF